MSIFPVAETFLSINGEGPHAGFPAFFIRFAGCNLDCSYCDTRWALSGSAASRQADAASLYSEAKQSGAHYITITGGEPLLQPGLQELVSLISSDPDMRVEIETNGSLPIAPFLALPCPPAMTLDYKLPGSGMEQYMIPENFILAGSDDSIKFVCASAGDLLRAEEIMERYSLRGRTNLFLSPVFGALSPAEIVSFMLDRRLTDVRLGLQLHKFVWNPDTRGV